MSDTAPGSIPVTHIQIRDVLGIRDLSFTPSTGITTVTGENASGKTSVVEAIQSVWAGGHDPTLLREGAEEGEIILLLEDGTRLRKRITPDRSSLRVKDPGGEVQSAPQTLVESIVDANPVALLTAPPNKRGEYLLESMPMKVSAEALREALGPVETGGEVSEPDASGHALEAIGRVHSEVYDARTEVNRAAKEKRKAAKEWRQSLPEEDAGVDAEALTDRIRRVEHEREELDKGLRQDLENIESREGEKVEEIRAEMQRRIEEVREEAEADREHERAKYGDAITEKKERLATLRERQQSAREHANTRQNIEKREDEAERYENESEALTAALKRLDDLKTDLLSDLPLDGVTITEDGQIEQDGVPFDRLNTARKIEIAVHVASLRTGKCGIVCVDGLEALDEDTFAEFEEWAGATDLQLVVTRVSDGPLAINGAAEETGAEAPQDAETEAGAADIDLPF